MTDIATAGDPLTALETLVGESNLFPPFSQSFMASISNDRVVALQGRPLLLDGQLFYSVTARTDFSTHSVIARWEVSCGSFHTHDFDVLVAFIAIGLVFMLRLRDGVLPYSVQYH